MKTNMIIVAAPSGAGKSSFVEKITSEDARLVDTVTYTTRSMRRGESQGHPYFFVEREDFEDKVKHDFFIEWAVVHNNLYGTPLYQIEQAWAQNKCIIMDVDVQGADTFKQKCAGAKTVFILPPSLAELRRRIEKRDGKVPDDIEVRMSNAEKEMLRADSFDFRVVNDDFQTSYQQFKKIVDDLLSST
ncbi:MAG: guanylate kinase [Pseudobdellovibrionaceae bacterium]|jgi:guanylate kinase